MAKKAEPENFTDMFAKLGEGLKLPNVDVEKVLAHHKKNLEALQKSAQAGAAGAQNLMAKQREVLQETLADITDMARNFGGSGNPQDFVAKQVEFARKSFEAAVKHAGDSADIVRKSGSESIEVLRARIKDAMEEVRETFEQKK
ncbi:MAG: phasin family protein [Rhizobiaceae bacterium]